MDPELLLKDVQAGAAAIHAAEAAPKEEEVLSLLNKALKLAQSITQAKPAATPLSRAGPSSASSSLLGLEEEQSLSPTAISGPVKRQISELIPTTTTAILKDPKVFITPDILQCYVEIQSLFNNPEHFPEIFSLYTQKPIPILDTTPVRYKKASPSSHKNAVPPQVAELALDTAIAKKNLPLVLAVIDTTYCSPAFYRSKILRKAGLPLTGLAIAPGAAYGIASAIGQIQESMEPGLATGIATAAILTYVGCTAAIGGLAVTTANDQMERVVWAPGMPLRHRWLREEERAALDKIANAWGFKEEWRRGEEEGEEWEDLKEFVGLRGMVLDKTELMQGME